MTSTYRNTLLAAAAVLGLAATSALAQAPLPGGDGTASLNGREPTGPAQPTPRLLNGKPDFTGFWKPLREPGKPGGNLGKDQPGFKLPFTPAGEAALKYNLTKTIDPEALCILGGIPRHNGSGLPFEILATPERAAWLYLYTTYRLIPIDGRKADPDPDPAYFGNSVAHWDGDTLVIETNGFKDSKDGKLWIDENANPQSDATTVVERWTRPDRDHIKLAMTVTDPKYYTRPFDFARTWVLAPRGEGLKEYACSENNIDAAHLGPGPGDIRPDGSRGYATELKLPDNPPGPEAYQISDIPVKK
jgi:hypothetical protein